MIINNQVTEQFKQGRGIINLHLLPLHHQLRVKRAYDGLTQGRLVELIGFSNVPRYSLIENGLRPVPEHLMEKVKQYLYGEEE